MRTRYMAAIALLALVAGLGLVGARAQTASPSAAPAASPVAAPATGAPTTLTLVERGLHITDIDLGPKGPSAGDMVIWGPDPLYDPTNTTDTGATTQGTCIALHDGSCVATETVIFPDGSTLQIQGIQAATAITSTRTIIGGSGRYRGASGTLTVKPTADRSVWVKTFALWP